MFPNKFAILASILGVNERDLTGSNFDINNNGLYAEFITFSVVYPEVTNTPLQNYGYMVTIGRRIQIITDYWGDNKIMFRTWNNGVWQPWHTFTMTN